MRYWRGRQKEREEGDGEGFVSQVRSRGGVVRGQSARVEDWWCCSIWVGVEGDSGCK